MRVSITFLQMSSDTNSAETVQATVTTLRILETLRRKNGMRLTELATELEMAKSTIHRYLQTLLQEHYLVKEGDTYFISARFLTLSEHARTRKTGYQLAIEKVTDLANETNERATFFIEENGYAVNVHREASSQAVRTDSDDGKRLHLHTIAAGKAIMAGWPDEHIHEFLDRRDLPRRTPNTLIDEEMLLEDISQIRSRGYATNHEESIEGLNSVASSICDPTGQVVGALSVFGPAHRLKGERLESEVPDYLLGITNEIELNIRYS